MDLVETVSARTATSITFSWTEGENNGGSPVTDYRVSRYFVEVSDFVVLATGITVQNYLSTGLTAGVAYKFKVEAQNEFGYSEMSEEVEILCATHPEKPLPPTATIIDDYVIFDWTAPEDNGTPITSYEFYIRSVDLVYIEDKLVCDGTNLAVIENT
jgi:hypothetical protein